MQKDRGTFGTEHPGGFDDHPAEQRRQVEFGADFRHHFQERHFLDADPVDLFDITHALQRDRCLAGHFGKQLQIVVAEIAHILVEALHYPDDIARHGAHRHAQDIASAIAGPFIDRDVEARVAVRIIDDQPFARLKDTASDAAVVEDADFTDQIALRDA